LIDSYFPNGSSHGYTSIKDLRGEIKRVGFNPKLSLKDINVQNMHFIKPYLAFLEQQRPESEKMYLWRVSIISQNRMFGHPPHSMLVESLNKWKKSVTTDKPVTKHHLGLIRKAVHTKLSQVLSKENPVTGDLRELKYLSKVSIQGSAEIDIGQKYHGKFEAFRQAINHIREHPVQRVNLETGALEGIMDDTSNEGEKLFHYALGVFRSKDRDILMRMRVHAVMENGKYRTITVSEFLHGIILHPISHILLAVLSKVKSSKSGVKAADHAWNFFADIRHDNPESFWVSETHFPWLCGLSTDLSNATDEISFAVSRVILNTTSHHIKVGSFYWKAIAWLLTTPRTVLGFKVFDEDDALSYEIEDNFLTRSGALMGDPVTKYILHMVHLAAREITANVMRTLPGYEV